MGTGKLHCVTVAAPFLTYARPSRRRWPRRAAAAAILSTVAVAGWHYRVPLLRWFDDRRLAFSEYRAQRECLSADPSVLTPVTVTSTDPQRRIAVAGGNTSPVWAEFLRAHYAADPDRATWFTGVTSPTVFARGLSRPDGTRRLVTVGMDASQWCWLTAEAWSAATLVRRPVRLSGCRVHVRLPVNQLFTIGPGTVAASGIGLSIPITYPGGGAATISLTLADDDSLRVTTSSGWLSPVTASGLNDYEWSPAGRLVGWPLPMAVPVVARLPVQGIAGKLIVGWSLAYAGEGRLVVAGDDCQVLDAATGQILRRFGFGLQPGQERRVISPLRHRVFSSDGDRDWSVCDLDSGQVLSVHRTGPNNNGLRFGGAAFSPDDRQLYVCDYDSILAFDADGQHQSIHFGAGKDLAGLIVTDDSLVSFESFDTYDRDPAATVGRNRQTLVAHRTSTLPGHGFGGYLARSSDGGRWLMAADDAVNIWDLSSERMRVAVTCDPDYDGGGTDRFIGGPAVFLPGNHWAVMAAHAGLVVVDADAGRWLFRVPGIAQSSGSVSSLQAVALSPNGRRLAVLTDRGIVVLNVADLVAAVAAYQGAEKVPVAADPG